MILWEAHKLNVSVFCMQPIKVTRSVCCMQPTNLTRCVYCMQPIKLRLKDHCVTAVMCQIRTDHDKALIRLSAMQKRTSLFALMFAEDGTLLNANQAALRKYGPDCIGGTCSMHCPWPSCKDGLHHAICAATDVCRKCILTTPSAASHNSTLSILRPSHSGTAFV